MVNLSKSSDGESPPEKPAPPATPGRRPGWQAKMERAVLALSVVVGLVAIGVIVHKHRSHGSTSDPTVKALGDLGVTPFVAGCGNQAPTDDKPVDQDTIVPDGTKATYTYVPPSIGAHLANLVTVNSGAFYTAADRPPIEGLVANLNAGWTVLWYDANALGPAQVDLIRKSAAILHKDSRYDKFVASEWDGAYGALPSGTPIALARWTKESNGNLGHRAFCHEASGEAILQYMIFFGAPEAVGEGAD